MFLLTNIHDTVLDRVELSKFFFGFGYINLDLKE